MLCLCAVLLTVFAVIATLRSASAATIITFEGLADSTLVGATYSGLGVTFTNATAITAGITLNAVVQPPHSGVNVAANVQGGPITILFASPQSMVGAYFTYPDGLFFSAFDSSNNFLGSVSGAFGSNMAFVGDPGSSPNEFLSLSIAGISSITISGGGTFTMDDLTFTGSASSVPESGTWLLLLTGVGLLGARLTLTKQFIHVHSCPLTSPNGSSRILRFSGAARRS
jgi:hypothetical protein